MPRWLKLGYFTQAPQAEPQYWLDRDWVSDGPGRTSPRWRDRPSPRRGETYPPYGPQYEVGDRLVIYITGRGVCPAIFEVTEEPRWDPGYVDEQGAPSEGGEGDRWGVVTRVTGVHAVPLRDAPDVEAIGIERASLGSKGHIELEEWQYVEAERLIAGTSQDSRPTPPVTSRDVPIEEGDTEGYEVMPRRAVVRALRKEAKLVRDYRASLEAQGDEISRKELRPPTASHPLYNDLFNQTRNQLIEAKASAGRGDIRMAIGQLADYARFVDGAPRRAVLLEARPHPDLLELLRSQEIGVIWRSGEDFEDDAGGAFT